MVRTILLAIAICSGGMGMSQSMNLHFQDGTTVLYEMASIDSVVYIGSSGNSMAIYLDPFEEIVHPVGIIDSITYSAGGAVGTPRLATLTPVGSFAGGLVPVVIDDEGGSAIVTSGVCWGTAPMPTVTDNVTGDGTGLGQFTSAITGLAQNTAYYARAYATNAQGTAYGNQVLFSTSGTGGDALNSSLTYGSVSDTEGNAYPTITIGSQVWMAENLRATRYANGDPITLVEDNDAWGDLSTGAWCYFQNDPAQNYMDGKLYNFHAVSDPRKVCPVGWHVPSADEWDELATFLGAPLAMAVKMKSVGSWPQSTNVTNISGFSGVPSGLRAVTGTYFNSPGQVHMWSSSLSGGAVNVRELRDDSTYLFDGSAVEEEGLSVRCVQD
ncbi:MAG: fibrobacter succinogenes major paralogous domain-containing protein [Flavobacteriales bacterium]|nr:fibrobacter succinogenes major paralogous domain-containing protein [Flavobacteriales bacterium]